MSQWKRDELMRLIARLEGAKATANKSARAAAPDIRDAYEKGALLSIVEDVAKEMRKVMGVKL